MNKELNECKELSELLTHLSDSDYMELLLYTLDKQKKLNKLLSKDMLEINK